MNERLVRSGVLLALLGVLTGFAPMLVTNPRMGLAAHVGGVMNALLLLTLGAVWSFVKLPPGRESLATTLLIFGGFGNWANVLVASITGATEFAPLAAAGHSAGALIEKATFGLIVIAASATLTGLALTFWGVRNKP
jgi:hydroxylaminobenzene mutase